MTACKTLHKVKEFCDKKLVFTKYTDFTNSNT